MSEQENRRSEAEGREMRTQEKRELKSERERVGTGRYFQPATDIYETADRLIVVMDMPGVARDGLSVTATGDQLDVEGRIDFDKYRELNPVHTEYNVGHFARSFTLSGAVDQNNIVAQLADGVLTLELPKAGAAGSRRIPVE
jgi:HSP20 family protein